MGIEHHYQPCFEHIPTNVTDRWTLLREFVSRWHNLNLPLLRDCERAARESEYTLDRTLPDSIREWIAFSKDLQSIDAFNRVLRDEFDVSRLNRLGATTLMIQGEGDVYWAIRDQHVSMPDPPVDRYYLDIDSEKWCHRGQDTRSLTSFVLGHMAYFLGTGYVRTRDVNSQLVAEMKSAFPVASDFDGLLVFEMTDLISFIRQRENNEFTLIVARKNSLLESGMPECIFRLIP